jgi:enoyl-CoA hydratase/carnithine racemase
MTTGVAPLPLTIEPSGEYAGIVTIRLEQPGKPVVVLDHELIQRLEATLRHLPREASGLVLASASERVFVAGADLKTIAAWDDNQLHQYLGYGARVFGMISDLPFPTVAAINGAVLGGGLELAMHCDALVAAPSASGKPYPVGLPEAGLAICPGWGGTNLLPARIEPGEAIRRTASGLPMNFDEAKAAGLFDAVAEGPALLLDASMRWIVSTGPRRSRDRDNAPLRWIGRPAVAAKVLAALDAVRPTLPQTEAAAAVVNAVEAGLQSGWQAALGAERKQLVYLRNTPAGKAAIEAFFAKSAGKP